MKVLDCFAGIGGFSLGLERAGFETVAFCEIEPYCQKVLARHWPEVPIYDDIRRVTADRLIRDGIRPDVITGGFPCQDISTAGKQAGIDGERSGLWAELARLLREIRPRYAIFENVPNLLNGDGGNWSRILWDIWQVGYDSEWHCVPASAVAPTTTEIGSGLAYPNSDSQSGRALNAEAVQAPALLAYPNASDNRDRGCGDDAIKRRIRIGNKLDYQRPSEASIWDAEPSVGFRMGFPEDWTGGLSEKAKANAREALSAMRNSVWQKAMNGRLEDLPRFRGANIALCLVRIRETTRRWTGIVGRLGRCERHHEACGQHRGCKPIIAITMTDNSHKYSNALHQLSRHTITIPDGVAYTHLGEWSLV